jgi:DNA-3-methyladenine glycosylase
VKPKFLLSDHIEIAEAQLLQPDFFARDTVSVAQELLGSPLVSVRWNGSDYEVTGGLIVETEAYEDENDPASHAYGGPKNRNRLMFEQPGIVYVYFIYGNHFCVNLVAHPHQRAGAVLIRALQPRWGVEFMHRRRSGRALCDGPGKLCQALSINASDNGQAIAASGLYLLQRQLDPKSIEASTRIGISKGQDKLWRFCAQL